MITKKIKMHNKQKEPTPIFIVGSPRSGTTLVRELLNLHPNLYVIPNETCFITWSARLFKKEHDTRSRLKNMRDYFAKVGWKIDNFNSCESISLLSTNPSLTELLDYLIGQNVKPPQHRWVEKTPFHVWYLDILYKLFPQAKFIHCIRDGRDCVVSMQSMGFKSRGFKGELSGWGLLGNAALWKYSVRKGLSLSKNIPVESLLMINYEELVTNVEQKVKAICQFIGEPFSEEMLNLRYCNSSYGCGKFPITSKSVGMWKKNLSQAEAEIVMYLLEPELKSLGYLQSSAKISSSIIQKLQAQFMYEAYRLKRETQRVLISSDYVGI